MIQHPRRFASWLPACFDGQFDWDFLRPACDFHLTKIEPMDFDAVIERNGHKLIFETKRDGKDIPRGQVITLTSVWKKDGFSILHVSGKSPAAITAMAIYSGWESPKDGAVGQRPLQPADAMDVLYAVRCWFCRANGRAAPDRESWNNELWLMDYDGILQQGF